jgi:hypothetical protein
MLRQSHRPDENRIRPLDEQPCEHLDLRAGRTAFALELSPIGSCSAATCLFKSDCTLAHEGFIDAAELHERAEDADEKRQIAARRPGHARTVVASIARHIK